MYYDLFYLRLTKSHSRLFAKQEFQMEYSWVYSEQALRAKFGCIFLKLVEQTLSASRQSDSIEGSSFMSSSSLLGATLLSSFDLLCFQYQNSGAIG